MTADQYDVVIVGAGHAGAQVAIALRQQGFAGSVALIGDEADPPYERPALSKEYLAGEKPFARLLLRPASFWIERAVTLIHGRTVVAIDPVERIVRDAAGGETRYGSLVWAAGGAPRRLTCEGHHLAGVHSVRGRADVDALRAELPSVSHAVVIGGGYIGLEAAAVLRKLGKSVTVLEAQDRVLARVAAEPLSRFYEHEHSEHGVDVRLGATVSRLVGDGERVTGVELADGELIATDLVVVGIGIIPAVGPLLAAGAAGANGVDVDEDSRTSLEHVYAAGDCACAVNPFGDGAPMRIESVQNASEQAAAVARAITGAARAASALPWFWSNQYDLRLQTAGLSTGYDETVLRGDPSTRAFSLAYLRRGQLVAIDCVNRVSDFVQARALIEARVSPPREALSDSSIPLKTLLAPGLPTA